MSNGFGKPSKHHSYTSDVHFDHVVLPLLKSGILAANEIVIVANMSRLYAHLIKSMIRCVDIPFTTLSKYNNRYQEQEFIPHERIMMFLAAAIYYNFNMATVMRYIGNNYTAKYRDVPTIMNTIRGILDDRVCNDVHRIITTGCPAKVSGHSRRENFLTY